MAALLLLRRRLLLLAGGGSKREEREEGGGGAKDEDDDETTPFGRWLLWDWQGRERRRRRRKRRRVNFGEEGASLFAANAVFILCYYFIVCHPPRSRENGKSEWKESIIREMKVFFVIATYIH